MQGIQLLFLVFTGAFAQTYPMPAVPLEINSLFYGYDGCVSVDPSFVNNQGVVLDANEIINVRQCTTAVMPNPNGGVVTMTRGQNRNVMAQMCRPNNPASWTYTDLDSSALSFAYPLVSGNDPQNFVVTLSDGSVSNPVCVQAFPANEENEMTTFVILGQDWGDGKGFTRNHVKIEIVGNVFFNVNGKLVNGRGLTFAEKDDPFEWLKYSSTLRLLNAKVVDFHARGDTAGNDCHSAGFTDTTNVIKLRFTGGGTTNGLVGLDNDQKSAFILRDAFGKSMDTGYLGVAGLSNDGDNNFDLCLDDTFDMAALDNVLVRCYGSDIIVPPKGPDFPCASHSLKVDKSRASADYINACKCDFDHLYNAVCDPDSRLPASHPAYGRNYCKVWDATSTCPDIFVDANGDSVSYQACNFRRPVWRDELTECVGLTDDVRAPSAEICRTNCEEDDACEVYQFYSNGVCSRGTSMDCSGTLTVVAGGRKEAPEVSFGEEFSCAETGCSVTRKTAPVSNFLTSAVVEIRETDFDSASEYVDIYVDGSFAVKCEPQQQDSESWFTCPQVPPATVAGAQKEISVVASPSVDDVGDGYGVISARLGFNYRCASDYGSVHGDPVCCGQPGTVGDPTHICPQDFPVCVGYQWNVQWGTCVKAGTTECGTQQQELCENFPCVDLREGPGHHHIMSYVSPGVANVKYYNSNFERSPPNAWTCTSSTAAADSLVGVWTCPGFYWGSVTITADYADDFTDARSNDHIDVCKKDTATTGAGRRQLTGESQKVSPTAGQRQIKGVSQRLRKMMKWL